MTNIQIAKALLKKLDLTKGDIKQICHELIFSPEMKQEEVKEPLVRSWEEAIRLRNTTGYYQDEIGRIMATGEKHGGVYATRKQIYAFVDAAPKLSQIVADANERCKVEEDDKWLWAVIPSIGVSKELEVCEMAKGHRVYKNLFPMNTKEIAQACLEMHRGLWEKFYMV